ncbi:probable ubiquitin-like-specific protease 2A isoform X3 [Miscanthus floridulus]|uniref:probable ubiquitin-like-specific protease 2A isoform X3 n=1 Tax=Miscanthus floridulus TaxID=154761 RepID=UPI003458E978
MVGDRMLMPLLRMCLLSAWKMSRWNVRATDSVRGISLLETIMRELWMQLPLNTLKSQGRAGKRDPISVDKMYSSQPSSTSLSAKRTHAIDPEVSDHEKCQNVESSLSRRFSKRRKEQLQNPSSVYSRKVQDVVLLDDEDMKPEEEVNCEMSDRRNEPKIYYPSRDNRESVELTRSDIKCLDPGVYLSSPVINFYIQYIKRNRLCTEDFRDKFYIFNTYFYGKLEEALYCPDEFSKLRRWWKGVNILNKAYIILPIHGTAHWSLVIICIPAKESISGPIILHLDSLAMHPSTKILNTVERYLEKEWRQLSSILGTTWEDLKSNIHKESVEVPRQNNEYDCGIFMLYYIERFIEEAPERFTIDKLDMFDRSWFKPEEASDLRRRIRELLLEEFESAKLDDALSGADASDPDDSIKDGELKADAPSDSSEMVVEVVGGLGSTVKSNEGIKVVASEEASGESGDAGKSIEGIVAASEKKSIEGINVAEPEEASEESIDACKSIGGINVAESDEASREFGETGKTNKGTKVAVSEGASVSGYTDKSMEDISDSEVAVLDKVPTSSCKRKRKTTSGECVDAGKSIEVINVAEPEEASEESRDAGKSIGGINVEESDEASGEFGEAGKTNKGTKVAVSEGASAESGYVDKIMEDISDSEVAVLDNAPTSSYKREKKATARVLSEAASFSDSVKDEEGTVKADSGSSKAEKEGDLIVIASPERSEGNDEIIGSSRIPDVVCDSCDSDTHATVRIVGVRKRNFFPSYGCSNPHKEPCTVPLLDSREDGKW